MMQPWVPTAYTTVMVLTKLQGRGGELKTMAQINILILL